MPIQTVNTKTPYRVIGAASMMGAAGAAVFLLLPIIVGSAMDTLDLSEEQAGLLTSSYFAGYLFSCIATLRLVQFISQKRLARASYSLLCLSLLFASLPLNQMAIALFMAAAGAGAGMLFGLAVLIIGQTSAPERNFGILLVAQQLFAAILLFALPQWVVPSWGFTGLLVALSVALGMGLLLLNGIDSTIKVNSNNLSNQAPQQRKTHLFGKLLLGLFALAIHFSALSAVWAFIERMAVDQNLQADQIGAALAFSMLGGVLGGLLVVILGLRIGRIIPIWLSIITFLAIFYGYSIGFGITGFAIITFTFSLSWNYILGYQMAIITALDATDRYSALIPGAQALGALTGPILAGNIIVSQGYNSVLVIAGFIIITASGLFLYLLRTGKNHA